MDLDGVSKIETVDKYVDIAFAAANKAALEARSQSKGTRLEKSRTVEIEKIKAISKALTKHLNLIVRSFPDMDSLAEFYKALIKNVVEFSELKKSLGAVNWASKQTKIFGDKYVQKIKACSEMPQINKHRREFYGRSSSFLKQISKNLEFLEETRKLMRTFPSIKTKLFTVCIAGFPNVGKSTLLSKLTSSKPEIKAYAFTTKNLNTGYMTYKYNKIQFIDTPGTLNRFDKMNPIEQMASLAIKYCAHLIIYVFDLTEPFPLKDQKKLLLNIKKSNKDILIYLSKTDILDKETVKKFKMDCFDNTDDLKQEIIKRFLKY